ncbi:MAG: hypothetical protein LBH25_01260 [Fibromonadaceae bacterium]|nr:hypothetical protein [Fibromonadaceae bacterium]
MGRKNVIGLIFQLKTSKGPAYGLCTHEDTEYCQLVYLYPIGTQLSKLKDATTQFCCFFPLRIALRQKIMKEIIKEVGRIEIPTQLKDFPLFRVRMIPSNGPGKFHHWGFWDGQKAWFVGEINDEQRKMPIRGIWNDTLIIERLEEGYIAENDPSL